MFGVLILIFILKIVIYFGNIIKHGIGFETALGTLTLVIFFISAFSTKKAIEENNYSLDTLKKARHGNLLENNEAEYKKMQEESEKQRQDGFRTVMMFLAVFALSFIIQVLIYIN